jgi:hypothetical protein
MSTQTSTVRRQTDALEKRIREFYALVNNEIFGKCFRHIDPVIRDDVFAVREYQYENSLRELLACCGYIRVVGVTLELHIGEPSELYANRDFAVGQTAWADEFGVEHMFQERWVRNGQRWYTRSTGFVIPTTHSPQDGGDF